MAETIPAGPRFVLDDQVEDERIIVEFGAAVNKRYVLVKRGHTSLLLTFAQAHWLSETLREELNRGR